MDPTTDVTITELGTGAPDLSMVTLFLKADIVVQAVMVLLLLASIWSWAVIVDKGVRLARLRRLANRFEDEFWSGGSLETLYDKLGAKPADPMSAVFVVAMREWARSSAAVGGAYSSLVERIQRVMNVAIDREMERVGRRVSFLATAGSASPFVGLFGTVWGIMNTFTAIADTNNTTLTTVAPGIAEALFATAMGLFVAIPAVVAYNKISDSLQRYDARMQNFADEFSAIVSRRLEESG